MIIHWPAFLCWVTQSPSPKTLKTSTRTTSSNCISSPTSTISDRRANTLLRGMLLYNHSDAHLLNIFPVMLSPGIERTDENPFSSRRWMEVIRSATVPTGGSRVPNSKESHPLWDGSPCLKKQQILRVSSAPPRPLCFYFLHISGTFVYVSMHIWCFLML